MKPSPDMDEAPAYLSADRELDVLGAAIAQAFECMRVGIQMDRSNRRDELLRRLERARFVMFDGPDTKTTH